MIRRALIVFSLVGCNAPQAAPTSPPAPTPAVQPVTAPDPRLHHEVHRAVMVDRKLAMCTDVEHWLSPPAAPNGEPWPPIDWPPPDLPVDEGTLVLARTCAEQFADRTVFGRCIIRSPTTQRFVYVMDVRYYDGRVYTDDTAMTSCLRDQGDWSRLDENDPRAQLARAEADLAEMERPRRR